MLLHTSFFCNFGLFVGFYGITTGKSIGSGTIIDSDGTILTCAHVVVDFQGMRGSSKGKVSDSIEIDFISQCIKIFKDFSNVVQ